MYNFLTHFTDQKCELVLRDRPFERTITLQKDSSGHVGFQYKVIVPYVRITSTFSQERQNYPFDNGIVSRTKWTAY